jgi:hypothetical protein
MALSEAKKLLCLKKIVHDFEPKGYQNLETFTSDNPSHD